VGNSDIANAGKQKGKKQMKLDGFGILVEDMAGMIRFYRDVLGFEIKETEDAEHVFLEKDGTLFMLCRRADFEKMTGKSLSYAKGTNGHYEIALSAADYAAVDRAFEEIVAAGGKEILAPSTMPWGQRTCYIADPEGNLVEIGSFQKGEA
jgi:lactoylglutathione lyase